MLSTAKNKQYVELVVALDPAMIIAYDNDEELLILKTVHYIARVQALYLQTDWGTDIGDVHIVLSNIAFIEEFSSNGLKQPKLFCNAQGWIQNEPSMYIRNGIESNNPYCEVNYDFYLARWNKYRSRHFSEYDNGALLSFYDFEGGVIGLAGVGKMCLEDSSGNINQMTFDDEYSALIVAHEMGHNFGMRHDGPLEGNPFCSNSEFIMRSKGKPGSIVSEFSECSKYSLQNQFAKGMSCLENKPLPTDYAVCRNGFVESGETCDCGQDECILAGDSCCDGSTCGLYANAECSNDDPCCENCKIMPKGTVCRALSATNSCDIKEEVCDGVSAECPPDLFYAEGSECNNGTGYCYDGVCKSARLQCEASGFLLTGQGVCGERLKQPWYDTYGYDVDWKVSDAECDSTLWCPNQGLGWWSDITRGCVDIYAEPETGTPCVMVNSSLPAQCVDYECQFSEDIYSYKWTVFAWNKCSIPCKDADSDAEGTQNRTVSCTLQDGEVVDDFYCDLDLKPINHRECNDFVCNFCAHNDICGENGQCDSERGVCDCDNGYDGTFCDVAPSLSFVGIVSMAYTDVQRGIDVQYRANPCTGTDESISTIQYEEGSTEVRTLGGVKGLRLVFVGSTVGVRWNSTGAVDHLAVGMIAVDEDGKYDDDEWPFYVGNGLASNSRCEEADVCYNDLSCTDFSFTIPTSIAAGNYKLIVRFNNEWNFESDVLEVLCSENNCNSVGHGQCNSDYSACECDEGWSGYSCEYSPCDDWEFLNCDGAECETIINSSTIKPKCFSSVCDVTNEAGGQCAAVNDGCSDPHFEGEYCEIPTDYCSTLSSDECDNDAQCQYVSSIDQCVYSDCYAFESQNACEGFTFNGPVRFIGNKTWDIFCEWIDDDSVDSVSEPYCNRITCGNDVLPKCENGAVRKPLFEGLSSICNEWYCDCSTVTNAEDSYWTVSDKSVLLDAFLDVNDSSLPLFTCSDCSLECQNGANDNGQCQKCDVDCPLEESPFRSGIECNQVFWISSFRINIKSDLILSKFDEFSALLTLDLAYFLGTDVKHISIWQIKPDGAKSIVYFRYLFDTNNDDETQIIGGDIMILASKEIADETSTATRGFIMKYTDSSYKFDFCLPNKEECDPDNASGVNFNSILLACFLSSICFESAMLAIYWFLTRDKREREYRKKLDEQRRALAAMNKNVVRVGMCDVSKKRAKQITKIKKESLDMVNDDSATEDNAEFVVEHVLEDVDEEEGDTNTATTEFDGQPLTNTTTNLDQDNGEEEEEEEEDFDNEKADPSES